MKTMNFQFSIPTIITYRIHVLYCPLSLFNIAGTKNRKSTRSWNFGDMTGIFPLIPDRVPGNSAAPTLLIPIFRAGCPDRSRGRMFFHSIFDIHYSIFSFHLFHFFSFPRSRVGTHVTAAPAVAFFNNCQIHQNTYNSNRRRKMCAAFFPVSTLSIL
jgi:hypothetical protein